MPEDGVDIEDFNICQSISMDSQIFKRGEIDSHLLKMYNGVSVDQLRTKRRSV